MLGPVPLKGRPSVFGLCVIKKMRFQNNDHGHEPRGAYNVSSRGALLMIILRYSLRLRSLHGHHSKATKLQQSSSI
jgi:hypothetical protein